MPLLLSGASLVWLVLMLATCATTWWLSKDGVSAVVGTIAILLIAMIKIRLVVMHFMEVRHAPRKWRLIYEVWLAVVTTVLIAVYLIFNR